MISKTTEYGICVYCNSTHGNIKEKYVLQKSQIFTHNYYDHVKYIPDRSDVLHSPFSYFQSLFDDVINDEGDEDEFTRHDKIVPCFYVLQKFYGSKFCRRYNSTSCRKFENNPSINRILFQKWNITYNLQNIFGYFFGA